MHGGHGQSRVESFTLAILFFFGRKMKFTSSGARMSIERRILISTCRSFGQLL